MIALAHAQRAGADHDTSAPVVSFTLSGTSGSNGWFRSDVTIRWSVVEPEGLTSTSGCEIAQLVSTEGTTSHTCAATSHGGTASSTATLKIDKTPPTVPVGTPSRAPDSNGWYNRAVGVGFSASDAVSGVDLCTGGSYGGPDSASASVVGTCVDRAGNSRSGSFGLAYDASAPAATVAASRGPDAGGWYNHALTVTFAQAPGDLSGPGSCRAPVDYSGPDTATASVAGTCTDRAGNTSGSVSLSFKYDDTPPQASASPSRAANASGWYNAPLTISFSQVPGDTSGSSGCSPTASYSGPDAASVSRSGTCTDGAGNTSAAATFGFKYDASPPGQPTATPARGPDANGWYNRALPVGFAAADAGPSGIDTCSSPTYSGPDSAAASVSGMCTDKAGNTSAARSFTFAYDGTAPQAVAAPSRSPNAAGWFNAPLTISFEQAPGDVSGSSGCSAPASYGGPDAASLSRSGTCVDGAGNTSAAATYDFKYDATPPATTAAPDHGSGGWYRGRLTVSFSGTDLLSGVSSCTAPVSYTGPDTTGTTLTGSCADVAGNASAAAFTVKFDATAPAVSAAPDRAPDGPGWYRRPFTVAFTGTDGGSGLEGCSEPTRYAGPDRASGLVSGSCRDAAGNTAEVAYAFRYDATPPILGRPYARVEKRVASIGWERSADVVAVEARRTPGRNGARSTVVYRGTGNGFADATLRPGVRYRYELSANDAAGNVAQAIVTATARPPLYRPAAGAVVRAPVRLAWEKVAGARFYNVQILRDGVKVLSIWPRTPSLALARRWTYDGKRQELAPGRYTWWVWAARGTVARPQYGRPLGSSTFVVGR